MYIKTGSKTYPCQDYRPGDGSVRFILSGAEYPEELGEVVELCGEDGFVLAEQRVADWLRWELQGTALVLTNAPVPAPAPEPDPLPDPMEPQLSTEASMAQEIISLRYDVDMMKLNGGNSV